MDAMDDLLRPLQLSYGTLHRSEAGVHAACKFLHNLQSGHLILELNFRNAFRCDKMSMAVKERAPHIYPLFTLHTVCLSPSSLEARR